MKLSTTFAMQMVEELSTILAQHINFIDKDGIIVASTDKNRIGSQHMGAKKLVEDNLPYLVIESDNEYSGSKQGVNLPIVVDEEIVGVIGITGEKNVVEKYGEIIRKFTQMYIRDEHIKQTRAQEEKMVSRFLENWLMHAHAVYEANFNDIAQSLGIVLNQPRRILMASFVGQESEDMLHKQGQLDQATRYLKRALCDSHNTYSLRIGTRHVFLLLDAFDAQIKEKCLKVKEAIFNAYEWDVRFGFDANAHPHIMHMMPIFKLRKLSMLR
jgi:carbohydrate diacid regulator